MTDWGMAGNDTKPDCVIAACCHALVSWGYPKATDAQVEDAFLAFCDDTACYPSQVMHDWLAFGIAGVRIKCMARLSIANIAAAIARFRGAYADIILPGGLRHAVWVIRHDDTEVRYVTWGYELVTDKATFAAQWDGGYAVSPKWSWRIAWWNLTELFRSN